MCFRNNEKTSLTCGQGKGNLHFTGQALWQVLYSVFTTIHCVFGVQVHFLDREAVLQCSLAVAHLAGVFFHLLFCEGSQKGNIQFSDIRQEVRLGLFYKGFDVRLRRAGLSYRPWRDIQSFQFGTWGNEV